MSLFKAQTFIACFLAYSITLHAGISKLERSIEVLPENLSYYSSFQKPDFAFLFLFKGIEIDSLTRNNPARNKYVIDSCLQAKNGMFFRLVFRNAVGEIFRYVDISTKKDLIAEGIKTDPNRNELEISRYYKSGAVQSRTGYIHQPQDISGTRRGDVMWYQLNPYLLKNGPEKIYYGNGVILIEREYFNGKLKDGSYTEYYDNGKIRKTYGIIDSRFDGNLKYYTKQGKLIEEQKYDGNKVQKYVAEKNRNEGKKAFLFGLDLYTPPKEEADKYPKLTIRDLDGCVNDINLLSNTLQRNGFDREHIVKVSDNGATKYLVQQAFRKFTDSVKKGDIVFIHFSGNGFYQDIGDRVGGNPELIIPCRDVYKSGDGDFSYYIRQAELEKFFSDIKRKVGSNGQLVLSIDVCHAGFLLPDEVNYNSQNQTSFRGETNNLLTNLERLKGAPTLILTGTSKMELAYEFRDAENVTYGAYSYMLAKALDNPTVINSLDLFNCITDSIKQRGKRQTPGYFALENMFLFETETETENQAEDVNELPLIKLTGSPFVLSVGISDYKSSKSSNLRFQNSTPDASRYADYFSRQFTLIDDGNKFKLTSRVLLNESATKEKLINAINDAISTTKPNDYFIFNFSGYCKPLMDSSGRKITYFVPYGLVDINNDWEIKEKGISLTQLKDLLQLIPANNQLFITEAGSTSDFQKEFIQALIETSPTIAALSNKNRVFIVPNSSGFDNCNCKNQVFEQGPINYYITNLDPELNIFGVFSGGIYADAVKFSLTKTESNCDYFRTPYFDIFFEKNFVADLKYFLPDELMQSRGLKKLEEDRNAVSSAVSKRYALIIGTDNYQGKPDWNNLNNPVYDAKELSESLEKNFGYNVKLLVDAPSDSIYDQVLKLSKVLLPTDQLLIFVGGHGDFDEKLFDDGFIVCQNSKSVKEDPYRNSYIQYSKLSRMINKLPAQQILMVLDVCFGGTFDERVARNSARSRTTYDDLSQDAYFNEKMKKRTRLYLTSGGKKEVPDGYKGKHSPFAVRLLQALDGKGGNSGILTATDLFQFVKMLPSGPLIGSFGDDEAGSEFVMLAK